MSKEETKVRDDKILEEKTSEKKEESKVYLPTEGQELEKYRYADTVISCAECGKDTVIEHPEFRNVEAGINLPPLYTTNQHFLALACSHCKAKLTLRMVMAEFPPAYDFNYERAYEVPQDLELTWKVGEKAVNHEVFIKDISKVLAEGEELKFESLGETKEKKFKLSLEENNNYEVKIDVEYEGRGKVEGQPIFLSTKENPDKNNPDKKEIIDNIE